jgi:hypothetical protein
MGRLVDLDTVPHWKITYTTNIRGHDELCETDMVLMKDLEKAPTIDAVEVVRCKDCKYSYKEFPSQKDFLYCAKFFDMVEGSPFGIHDYAIPVLPEDYCSKAERRETK